MTPNDSQIELLIRRHAQRARKDSVVGEHLDADALNAFAEGALPAATRSRYVSHLAECGDCRKIAGELSVYAHGATQTQTSGAAPNIAEPWWRRFSSLFALPALRYAALATVLVAIVGITFLAWRRPQPAGPELVAQNQPEPTPISAVKPGTTGESRNAQSEQNGQAEQTRVAKALPQPTTTLNSQDKSASTSEPPPPPKPEAERAITESKSALSDRPAAPARADATPSFAPPPRVETQNEVRGREAQNVGGITHGGPRRNESSEKFKVLERARTADVAKEEDRMRGGKEADENKKDTNQPRQSPRSETSGAATSAPRDLRIETRKSENTPSTNPDSATRSVGGRKFQRQGSAWVDLKFKPSMSLRNVARGSEEFDALDSRLRSIAQQLSGEVIIVWKGKAYRIQ